MKKRSNKLTMTRETLRPLSHAVLGHARGGKKGLGGDRISDQKHTTQR